MTHASPYALAQARIAARKWRVDPDAGLIYGTRGKPLHRLNTWGYVQLKLRDPDDWTIEHAVLAHRVIWEHTHGPLTAAEQVNHLNGIKTDNRISNLAACTQSENIQHAYATGLNRPTRPTARLSEADVLTAYRRAWTGERDSVIAADYGVDRSTISNIKNGWSWTHITGHQPRGR